MQNARLFDEVDMKTNNFKKGYFYLRIFLLSKMDTFPQTEKISKTQGRKEKSFWKKLLRKHNKYWSY